MYLFSFRITFSTKLTCVSHSSGGSMSVDVLVLCATDHVAVLLSIFLLIIQGKSCALLSVFIVAIEMTPWTCQTTATLIHIQCRYFLITKITLFIFVPIQKIITICLSAAAAAAADYAMAGPSRSRWNFCRCFVWRSKTGWIRWWCWCFGWCIRFASLFCSWVRWNNCLIAINNTERIYGVCIWVTFILAHNVWR